MRKSSYLVVILVSCTCELRDTADDTGFESRDGLMAEGEG